MSITFYPTVSRDELGKYCNTSRLLLVARRGERIEAAGMLLTFRWHERCRLRARWRAGYGAIPSPYQQRYHDLLLDLQVAIMSSMTNECEVLA